MVLIIKEYRRKLNISQEVLAEKLNISTRQVQRLENGQSKPSLKTLKNLIIVLNISDQDIIKYIKEYK